MHGDQAMQWMTLCQTDETVSDTIDELELLLCKPWNLDSIWGPSCIQGSVYILYTKTN